MSPRSHICIYCFILSTKKRKTGHKNLQTEKTATNPGSHCYYWALSLLVSFSTWQFWISSSSQGCESLGGHDSWSTGSSTLTFGFIFGLKNHFKFKTGLSGWSQRLENSCIRVQVIYKLFSDLPTRIIQKSLPEIRNRSVSRLRDGSTIT